MGRSLRMLMVTELMKESRQGSHGERSRKPSENQFDRAFLSNLMAPREWASRANHTGSALWEENLVDKGKL